MSSPVNTLLGASHQVCLLLLLPPPSGPATASSAPWPYSLRDHSPRGVSSLQHALVSVIMRGRTQQQHGLD